MIDSSVVRCGLPAHDSLTLGDWFKVMPFADTIRLYRLNALDLRRLLLDNARRAGRPDEPFYPDRVMGGAPKQLQQVVLHLGAQRRGPLAYRYQPVDGATRYRLAPWCYRWEGGFYHDFRAEHRRIDSLATLLDRYGATWSAREAETTGADAATLAGWLRKGYVVF